MLKYVIFLCSFIIMLLLTKVIENRFENEHFKEEEQSTNPEKMLDVQFTMEKTQHLHKERSINHRALDSINILRIPLRKRSKRIVQRRPDEITIFAITPTYKRFLQKAELTRICNTFRHVKNFHWILVEDSRNKTKLVEHFLSTCGLIYTHLNIRTPKPLRRSRKQPRWAKSRGVEQRNLGLEWIRKNVNPNQTKGVVYFADDDNTYDVRLFEEMRSIHGVGIWPVAFTGAARWSGPICRDGKVTGFHNNWKPWRKFPIDMAGFAINIRKIISQYPDASFQPQVRPGLMETSFLEQITRVEELEPKADNCMKVFVWHTRTETPVININGERQLIKKGHPSNPSVET
ncbi:hypothetical protein QZH41_016131 [Actinostola sp. cb2023]|nr:hypothetical protein QZH41_016131 [Actinostola sp. cb2023]